MRLSPIVRFFPGIIYFIFTFYLLTIPGKELPDVGGWFDAVQGDKWVHVGMFGLLVVSWVWPYKKGNHINGYKIIAIAIIMLAYGIGMEFYQEKFVTNRAFDVGDIAADGTGALIAAWLCFKKWLQPTTVKKIGPDGNQGLNQN